MHAKSRTPFEWDEFLAAERRIQRVIPEAVLVGGTAAALHAGHRISLDADHVVIDLKDRFDEVLARLESEPGWSTDRFQKPVLILGSLEGYMTGIRQLRRTHPIEVTEIDGLKVPDLVEMARIKAWLLLSRDTTRDLLDTAALLDKLGEARLAEAFSRFEEIYGRGPQGGPALVELVDRMAAARPSDRAEIDLASYKGVASPWNEWKHIEERSRHWASRLAGLLLRG